MDPKENYHEARKHGLKIVLKSMCQWFQLNNGELFLAKNKQIYIYTVTTHKPTENSELDSYIMTEFSPRMMIFEIF